MAVLIKGMEMPQNCQSCNFYNGLGCKATGMMFSMFYNVATRRGDCPLIEVHEPHGRLIDAEKLKSYWAPDHSRYFDADYFIHTIDVAQTIIPASEEG